MTLDQVRGKIGEAIVALDLADYVSLVAVQPGVYAPHPYVVSVVDVGLAAAAGRRTVLHRDCRLCCYIVDGDTCGLPIEDHRVAYVVRLDPRVSPLGLAAVRDRLETLKAKAAELSVSVEDRTYAIVDLEFVVR